MIPVNTLCVCLLAECDYWNLNMVGRFVTVIGHGFDVEYGVPYNEINVYFPSRSRNWRATDAALMPVDPKAIDKNGVDEMVRKVGSPPPMYLPAPEWVR